MQHRGEQSRSLVSGGSQRAAAFSRLYDEHSPQIRAYCVRRVRRHDVDDAVAEVFAVAWRRIDDLPTDGTELYWLYGVARNLIRNMDRSSRRRVRLSDRLRSLGRAHQDPPDVQVVRSEEAQGVLRALSSLRPSDQEVLRLRMWEELDRHEIATVLGISPAAADMRVNRAVKRMADALRRSGVADAIASAHDAGRGEQE